MSSNTELGRAVQDACEELDNLSNLVGQATYQAKQCLKAAVLTVLQQQLAQHC